MKPVTFKDTVLELAVRYLNTRPQASLADITQYVVSRAPLEREDGLSIAPKTVSSVLSKAANIPGTTNIRQMGQGMYRLDRPVNPDVGDVQYQKVRHLLNQTLSALDRLSVGDGEVMSAAQYGFTRDLYATFRGFLRGTDHSITELYNDYKMNR